MLSEKVLEIKTTLPIQWILMEGKSDWLESIFSSFLFLYHLDYFSSFPPCFPSKWDLYWYLWWFFKKRHFLKFLLFLLKKAGNRKWKSSKNSLEVYVPNEHKSMKMTNKWTHLIKYRIWENEQKWPIQLIL